MAPSRVGIASFLGMSDRPSPSGGSPRGARRFRRHLLLGGGGLAVALLLAWLLPGPLRERASLATAYVGLGLLALTLSLGPLNVLRGRPNPVSFDRRRDAGIWSAVFGAVHTAIGLTVHFTGRMHLYFLAPPEQRGLLGLRADPFGAANHAGLLAVALLLLLAVISNDRSLRRLGTARWRGVQRWAYLLAALTILHGALYQLLEKQRLPLVVLFVVVALVGLVLQLAGRRRVLAGRARVRTS